MGTQRYTLPHSITTLKWQNCLFIRSVISIKCTINIQTPYFNLLKHLRTHSADDKLLMFCYFFPENGFWHFMQTVSCVETVCMKCQSPFSGKNKKNISKYLLKFLPSMQSINFSLNKSILLLVDVSKNCWISANSVNSDQTRIQHLIVVCTVCSGLSACILQVNTINMLWKSGCYTLWFIFRGKPSIQVYIFYA